MVNYEPVHARVQLKSASTLPKLASATEANLVRLGFKFMKNETKAMLEFEVIEPEAFLVRIRSLEETEQPSPILGFMFARTQSACTDLSLVVDPGNPAAKSGASELIKAIIGSLKVPPWKGLGMVESRTSKALWTRYAAGLE
jgi:hypothetical protein